MSNSDNIYQTIQLDLGPATEDNVNLRAQNKFGLYSRLASYMRPYRFYFAAGILAAVGSGFLEGLSAWLAGQGVQKILVDRQGRLIFLIPLFLLTLAILHGILRFIELYYVRLAGQSAVRDLRNDLFYKIEQQSITFFEEHSSGSLIARVFNDAGSTCYALSQAIQLIVSRVSTVIALVVVLLMQNLFLSLVALFFLSTLIFPARLLNKRIREATARAQEAIGKLIAIVVENVQGIKIIQTYRIEKYQNDYFASFNSEYLKQTMDATATEAFSSPALTIISAAVISFVIMLAANSVINNQMTLGAFTSFTIALLLLYIPLRQVGTMSGGIQPAMVSAQRIFEVLDVEPTVKDQPGATDLAYGPHTVTFDKVSFKYPTQTEYALTEVSFVLEPDQIVALVGFSGAGKSTIANLLPRFYAATAGVVLIDGKALDSFTLSSLRDQMAIVGQDSSLFDVTVRENIKFGRLTASEQEIEDAAKAAYVHDFIVSLPQGYQTVVGERGVKLSGGQQQRIAIARAFLKNAPILILDEATSSLDNEAEAIIQKALYKLMKGRTTLVIAHRLSTVVTASKILVLDRGKIAETGTHQSLSQVSNAYGRLVKEHFREYFEANN